MPTMADAEAPGSDASIGQLRRAYRRDEVILFVGAGVSLSIGVPPWSALIEHMTASSASTPPL
jgi:hypothetical protein